MPGKSDEACLRWKKIVVNEREAAEVEKHPDFWRNWAEQTIANNRERKAFCEAP